MSEVVTYIRCKINEEWTNLGIIADEDEIQEHFEFVEELLKQKQHADGLEKRWDDLTKKIEDTMLFIEGEMIYANHNYSKDNLEERLMMQHLDSFHSGFANVRKKMMTLERHHKKS